ncbi:glycosyltransferase family 2 protein [Sharpea azabuensis]|uniref:Glycosyltransferase family 2 protein n=1 Tax=Sharpea porci TaxID=2652286 RepID=A0A844FQL8_9FIRM|nr:glycosyltransferase family 2 protein [Sharpea porci]
MYLVTIITPIYNGEKYLMRYSEQVNAIGYKNLQIIVVNDGSKDKTSEIVKKIC